MKTKQLSTSDLFITTTRFGASAWEQSLAPIHRALELLGRISPTAAMVLAVVLVAVIAWFDRRDLTPERMQGSASNSSSE